MIVRAFAFLAGLAILVATAQAQVRVQLTRDSSLKERLKLATGTTDDEGRVWVGYAIRRLMERNSYVSTGWMVNGRMRRTTTLEDVLAKAGDPEAMPTEHSDSRILRGIERVEKRLAILIRYNEGDVDRVEFQTTDATYDSSRTMFVWIGEARDEESAAFVVELFDGQSDRKVLEHIVTVAALHDDAVPVVGPFLRRVLAGAYDGKVRRAAAYGLGGQPSRESLVALSSAARTTAEESLQRDAVWALSQLEMPGAVDTLIALALEAPSSELRRTALMAVAQCAAEKTLETLTNVVENDPDTDVRRSAVWGLSQLRDGAGVPSLIALARSHPNPTVRKEAVHALGQSKDERAFQALIEIVRK